MKKERKEKDGKPFQKVIVKHHYVNKENWSKCWMMDCVEGCPEKYCWKTAYDCDDCNRKVNNESCIKSEMYNFSERKYEEELHCDRKLPIKMDERIRLLFAGSILDKIIK